MIQAKCIQKFRDKKGKIYGYRLQDLNGQTQDVKPENLKQAILSKQIHIVNLTLTSDNRLIDSSEKSLSSSKLGPKPNKPCYENMTDTDKLRTLNETAGRLIKATDFGKTDNIDYWEINDTDIATRIIYLYISIQNNLIDASVDIGKKTVEFYINDSDNGELNGDYKGEILCKDMSINSMNKAYDCIIEILDKFNGEQININIAGGEIESRNI